MSDQTDVLQGTLDLLIMKTIALQPMHGWAIAQRIQQISDDLLRVRQASGLDHRGLGRIREQSARSLLRAHQGGP